MSEQRRRMPEERYWMEHGPARRRPEFPPTPLGFKVWFGVVGVVGAGLLGLTVWAVVRLVLHYT